MSDVLALLILPELFETSGGIQRFCRNLTYTISSYALPSQEIVVLSLKDAQRSVERMSLGKVEFIGHHGRRLSLVLNAFRSATRKPKWIILGHTNLAPLAPVLKWVSPRSKLMTVLYGFEAWHSVHRMQLLGLQCCDHLLSISYFTQTEFCRHNHFPPAKVSVIHLGLDPFWQEKSIVNAASLLTSYPRPYLLTVSRLELSHISYKGIKDTLDVFKELLLDERLANYHYVIVGEGDGRDVLEKYCQERGLSGRVHFAGRVSESELQHLYAGCDVFVLPSQKEGFGLVYLEAMAYARPVVASRAAAIEEVIEDGQTGFLVLPGDRKELKDRIAQLLHCPKLRADMGIAGKRRLENNFSYNIFRQHIGQLLGIIRSENIVGME